MFIKRFLTILLSFTFCLWLVVELPFFKIKHITITGTNLLSLQPLQSLTQKWYNISFLRLYLWPYYRHQLHQTFPEIDTIQLYWEGNHHTRIHITEKSPTMLILNNGKSNLMAQDGSLFTHYDSTKINSDGMLIIRGISATAFQQTYFNQNPDTPFHRLIQLIQTELQAHVIQLEMDQHQWTLLKNDTLPFLLGDLSILTTAHNPIKILINQFDEFQHHSRAIRYIDLRLFPKVIVGYE